MADIEDLMPLIKQFLPFAKERMGFQDPPRLFLKGDSKNAANPLGRTAFYDPEAVSITLYTTDRHPKDIMRSLSHELVHHTQNCNGDFSDAGEMGEGYAQDNPHMREMERQAYEKGNMCFRDWEDSIKQTIYFEHLQKGDYTMSTKDWKNGEIKTLLSEAWGFKMDLNRLNEVSDNEDVMDAKEETEGDAVDAEEEAALEEDSAAKHRTAGNTIDEESDAEIEECGEMPEEGEIVVMGDEEPGVEVGAGDPAARVGALMDELKGLLMQLAAGGESADMADEDPMEEGGSGRKDPVRKRPGRDSDDRTRPMQEEKMREMVRKAIKEAMK